MLIVLLTIACEYVLAIPGIAGLLAGASLFIYLLNSLRRKLKIVVRSSDRKSLWTTMFILISLPTFFAFLASLFHSKSS